MPKTESKLIELGTPAAPFVLPDAEGRLHALDDFAGKPALLVVFLSNRCPFVLLLREHFGDLARRYAERGLQVVGINANDPAQHADESLAAVGAQAEEAGYVFPYLKDYSQAVAKAYGAACTPDFFLFDQERRLAYHGQYDEARPGNGKPVTGADLAAAIEAVLAGQHPLAAQTPSIGCNIKWREATEPARIATAA